MRLVLLTSLRQLAQSDRRWGPENSPFVQVARLASVVELSGLMSECRSRKWVRCRVRYGGGPGIGEMHQRVVELPLRGKKCAAASCHEGGAYISLVPQHAYAAPRAALADAPLVRTRQRTRPALDASSAHRSLKTRHLDWASCLLEVCFSDQYSIRPVCTYR